MLDIARVMSLDNNKNCNLAIKTKKLKKEDTKSTEAKDMPTSSLTSGSITFPYPGENNDRSHLTYI